MPKDFRNALLPLLFVMIASGAAQLAAQTPEAPAQGAPSASPAEPLSSTEEVIRDVMEPLQRGIDEHNLSQVLAVFDPQETPDYAQLRDQMRAFFSQNQSVRFRYKVLQVTSEDEDGFVIAEIDMVATSADETKLAVQQTTQMRFQVKRGKQGWKIVGFTPSDFFTP